MKPLGYTNTCLLMLLFCAIAISAQGASGGNGTNADDANNNNTATGDSMRQEIHQIMLCMKNTKIIGPILNNINEFSDWLIIALPKNITDPYIVTFYRIIAYLINIIIIVDEIIREYKKPLMLMLKLAELAH